MTISDTMLSDIRVLEPLSSAAQRLLTLLGSSDYELEDVVAIVQSDLALTARLLRFTNSAAFGLGREVDSVEEAVRFAGDKIITGLALEGSATRVYASELSAYGCEGGALWRHSLITALFAREFAQRSRDRSKSGLAFAAGLLHDVGKVVLAGHMPASPSELLTDREVPDFEMLEQRATGADHSELGAQVAEHWELPRAIVESIRHHHHPSESAEDLRAIVHAVHLGDFMAMMAGLGTGADDLQYQLDPDYEAWIDLEPSELDRLSWRVREEFDQLISSLEES
jgi:putative nucleotidyltransferase with HDIG domain